MKHLPLAVSLSKNQYNNKIEVYYQTDEHFFFVMASDLASFFYFYSLMCFGVFRFPIVL